MVKQFVEDFSNRATPAGARRHGSFEMGRVGDQLMEFPGQFGGATAQLLDQILFGLLPPTPDLAGIPSVLIKWLAWSRAAPAEGRFEETWTGLLGAAQVCQQIMCGPSLVTRRPPPRARAYALQSLGG